jgi:DNA-binding HxlR family transcriptional regulator
MNIDIVQGNGAKLPRAIAKEKDGIVMYWVEELNEGGLHLKGLARLLKYDHGSLAKTLKVVEEVTILEAEIVTESGVKMVYLYTGQSIAKILRHISRSRANQAVRDLADDIRDSLAAAGFKLAVMLELAPQQLADQAQSAANKQERALPPAVSIHQYMVEAREWGLESDPFIKSLVTQRLAEELGSKALPSEAITTQVILTVRASELGYDQRAIGSGSQLGKFVSRIIQPVGKTQHGKYPVNVYELTPELDDCIHAFSVIKTMGKSPADDRYRKSPAGRRAKKAQNQRYQNSAKSKVAISKAANKYELKVKRICCTYTEAMGLDNYNEFIKLAAEQKCSTSELTRQAIKLYLDYINKRRLI